MTTNIFQTAAQTSRSMPVAFLGMLAYLAFGAGTETVSAVNSPPQAEQVGTVVIDTATSGEDYSVLVNGVEVEVTAASNTAADVATLLCDAINAEPLVRGQVAATVATATVTITSNWPGIGFTLTEGQNAAKMTATESVTANDTADEVAFGRAVVWSPADQDAARVADANALTAQVDSYVLTYDAAVEIVVDIVVDGVPYRARSTMATDLDTSGAAIAAAVNYIMPANTVLAAYTAATDTLSLTAEVDGKAFVSNITFGPGADTGAAAKTSTAPSTSDLTVCFAGITTAPTDVPCDDDGAAVYAANSSMRVCRKGGVWVANTEGVARGDKVYVETTAGATAGRLYKTSSATRIHLPNARWERASDDGLFGLVVLS